MPIVGLVRSQLAAKATPALRQHLPTLCRALFPAVSARMLSTGLLQSGKSYINGQWVGAKSGAVFGVVNPATNETLIDVPDMGGEETRDAIAAAKNAFPAWRKKTAKERSVLLRAWFDAIMANKEELAKLITQEMGKPLDEARGEVVYGASFVEWFAEEAKRAYGDVIPGNAPGKRIAVIKQPIGVCGLITPWNFPIGMATRKIAPALAAGCTVVVKPSEDAPLTTLAVAALAEKVGIPAGVINIITGSRKNVADIGKELTTHPDVAKVSFTGSTAVGKLLLAQGASTVKRITLELGGNAPFIVFDDAYLDAAVKGLMASKFRNTGQTCVCANRIYVQEGVYAQFAEKLVAAVQQLKVGNGMESGVTQGPLINAAALSKVESHVKDATSKGARVLIGGKPHSNGGLFYEPTVLADITPEMAVNTQETFGPVAPLIPFKTEEEVIKKANAVSVGLAGYFYSQNLRRAYRVAEALEVGMVGINDGIISTEVAPFGGWKESGLGREGSKYGMDAYMEIKYLCFGNMDD
eukprot:comp22818_c0_seq1/m.35829 comp22818_c0_seq1/g.35829  ORF comp22818_c0_seq1/g.35829 comp22818_c0_seq1/m.35829 type:complete len:525 (-) comp22818_c0_seq1:217-1791(-)